MTLPTIESLAAELAAGRSSSLALTEQALARARDPAGEGARTYTRLDAERALALARASDALRAAGVVRSPLEGLPLSVKDCIDVAGLVTAAGSAVLRGAAAATDNAPVVQRLLAAGAVLLGHTNMTEFAFSGVGLNPHYGTPANPWDRETRRIPGGSSSGAAVSVADGMAVAAVGTDTGGSVRIPAALCGLVGFKPTQRRVPRHGTVPLSTSLDSIGPLAASVRCCAIVDAVLAGQPVSVPRPRPVSGVRLAIPQTVVLERMDAQVANTFERAVAALSAAGAHIQRLPMPEFSGLRELRRNGTLAAAESWAWHHELLATRGDEYDPRVAIRIRDGERMSAADYITLLGARRQWVEQVGQRMADFDALLLPTVPMVAPPIADLDASDETYFRVNGLMLRNPSLINFLDGCGLSLPCHPPGEAPVGLMLAAPGGRDRELLALGQGVERILEDR